MTISRVRSILSAALFLAPIALMACAAPAEGADDPASTIEAASTSTTASQQAVLDLVAWPGTDVTTLDVAAKLDARAAKNVIAKRNGADGVYPSSDDAPFTSIAQLQSTAYVGTSGIAKLTSYAAAHPAPKGETVEGVAFANWQSAAVVWGVNHSTEAQLDALIDSRAAKGLVAKAPFVSVAQIGSVAYVASKALTALRGQSVAWWNASKAPASCVATFEAAVAPHLGDLLFMSESDRPFDLVAFPGAGASAPTAASVLALVKAPAGYTSQVRATADYFTAFEPSSAAADPNAAADVQAAFATLSDVTYVAVFAPAGSVNQALVDVYLVGRTSCGDLVGIHAIAVET